jgi:hypothetical protein
VTISSRVNTRTTVAPRHYQHSKNTVDEQMPAVAIEAQVDCSGAAHISRHDPCSFGVVVWIS